MCKERIVKRVRLVEWVLGFVGLALLGGEVAAQLGERPGVPGGSPLGQHSSSLSSPSEALSQLDRTASALEQYFKKREQADAKVGGLEEDLQKKEAEVAALTAEMK